MENKTIKNVDCKHCGGQGSKDLLHSPNYEYLNCQYCDGSGEEEVVLTEFFVTETYTIRAQSEDDATDMVLDENIDGDISRYNLTITPNF